VPEWLHLAAYSASGIYGDRAFLLSELTGIFSVFKCAGMASRGCTFRWRNKRRSCLPAVGINVHLFVFQLPEWLHLAAHSAGGINGDRAVLLIIVSFTLFLIHLVNSALAR
jgi:hypothetical protein